MRLKCSYNLTHLCHEGAESTVDVEAWYVLDDDDGLAWMKCYSFVVWEEEGEDGVLRLCNEGRGGVVVALFEADFSSDGRSFVACACTGAAASVSPQPAAAAAAAAAASPTCMRNDLQERHLVHRTEVVHA